MLTRKSSDADEFNASITCSASASPCCRINRSTIQLGVFTRIAKGKVLRSIAITCCNQIASCSLKPPIESVPTESAKPSKAIRRIKGPEPLSEKLVYTDLLRNKL